MSAAASPSTTSVRSAALLLGTTIAIGSVAFTFVKVALRELSPMGLAAGRVVSSALLFVLAVSVGAHRRRPIERGDRLKVLFVGFGGSAAFHMLFNAGQQHVSVAMAAVVMATMPVLTAVGEVLFLRHRLRRDQVLGLALTTIGCVVIGFAGGDEGGSSLLGLAAIAAATATWAAVTVVTRGLGDRYDAWWLNTPGTVLGAVVMIAVEAPHAAEYTALSWRGWLIVLWLGTASSAFIYYAYARVLTVISGTTATAVSTVVTPSSMVVAWLALGEPPSAVEALGGVVVIAGVIAVTRRGVVTPLPPAELPAP